MKWLFAVAVLIGLGGIALVLYARFLSVPPELYHRKGEAKEVGEYPAPGGHEVVRHVQDADATLAELDAIIRATERTKVLAGSVDEGHLSYVTRSALIGFPDITNLWTDGNRLHLAGHLVVGYSDLGVNRRRIETWLGAAQTIAE